MSSSSAERRELDAVLPDNISTELALWKQLIFDSDMPPSPEKRRDDPGHDRTVPPVAPPQLPPETYTYLIQALLSLQGSVYPHNYPSASSYPTSTPYNYLWPPDAPPIPPASIAGPSSFYPPIPPPPRFAPQDTGTAQLPPSPPVPPSTAQDPDGTEDVISTTEDKRRRNTAASARFRVKKKLRTLSLERTVADLTGRTDELEREASDLRRENTWLKEIVLLKGRNLATPNVGSQTPASGNQCDKDENDDHTETVSEPDSTVKHGGKGKDKEN